jgi:hypothetical protein
MTSIRPFAIACGIGFVSMLGAAPGGNAIYRGETEVRWTPLRIGLALVLLLGFLLFVYMLVPLLLRMFLLAQLRARKYQAAAHPVAVVSRADRMLHGVGHLDPRAGYRTPLRVPRLAPELQPSHSRTGAMKSTILTLIVGG